MRGITREQLLCPSHQVRHTVTSGMETVQQDRAADPGASLWSRLRAIAAKALPAFDIAGEAAEQ
jgi:hypothetical protein